MTRQFSKTVAIKATDSESKTATGTVLTPNELDKQLDFLDETGVRRMFTDAPADGVMHASFPMGHSELTRNEVLDAEEEIGGETFDKGEWVIQRKYTNPERWQLVRDGVLSGFSIGGEASETIEYDSMDALPSDVSVPAGVNPESVPAEYHPPAKITNGTVNEISDVDLPAVTSSTMSVAKHALGKNVLDHTDGRDEFVELMTERGATEDGAESLYEYMTDGATKTDPENMDDATKWQRFKTLLGSDVEPDDPNGKQKQMTDDDPFADAPEWAKAMHDTVEKHDERIETLAEKTKADDPDGGDGSGGDGPSLAEQNAETISELSETVEDMGEKMDETSEKVDQIAEQGGASQQAGKSEPSDDPSQTQKALEIEREVFTA